MSECVLRSPSPPLRPTTKTAGGGVRGEEDKGRGRCWELEAGVWVCVRAYPSPPPGLLSVCP